MDERAEAGLALDDGVGDALLTAQRGQPDDELDGVHVVGDGHEADLMEGWSVRAVEGNKWLGCWGVLDTNTRMLYAAPRASVVR